MVARVTLAEIDAVRQNPEGAIGRFQDSVVPALEEQAGYEGCYVLLSDEGKVLVLTFWADDDAARASRLSGFYAEQIEKLSELVWFKQAPGREAYDVVVAETPAVAVG